MSNFYKHFKNIFLILWIFNCLFLLNNPTYGQFNLISATPADGEVNVSTLSTIQLTFSAPLDTNAVFSITNGFYLGIQMFPENASEFPPANPDAITVSNNMKTVTFSDVTLSDDTKFTLLLSGAKSNTGDLLDRPYAMTFTTGSTLPVGEISGEISFPDKDPGGAVVELFTESPLVNNNDPEAITVVPSSAVAYTVHYLPAGNYWPVTVKDTNRDAQFDLIGADASGFYDPNSDGIIDSVKVLPGSRVTGINMTLSAALSLESPNGGEFLAGGQIKEVNWSTARIQVDHITLLYSTDSGNSYPNLIADLVPNTGSYNWTLPQVNSSTMRVEIQAKDANNVVLAEDVSKSDFTIDSTPPNSFNLNSPTNGSWETGSPTFSWTPSSDELAGLLKYQLIIDGVVNQDSIPPTATISLPTNALSNGFHTWNVKAIDKAGNERSSNQSWTVRVDAASPTAFNLLLPEDSTWTANPQPEFTWQASSDAQSGLSKYQLFINGNLNRDDLSISQTSTTPVSALSSGDHTWYIQALDIAGNTTQSNQTWTIRIDKTAPTTFNLTSPAHNSWTGDTTPTFSWQTATDANSGLSKYELWVDGVSAIDNISSSQTNVTLLDSLELTPGNHTWRMKAYDYAGNMRQTNYTWTIRVDTQSPSVFSLSAPNDSAFVNFPTPNFSWNATTDAGAGISHYQLWIDGSLSADNITSITSSPGTPITEGFHNWYVKAFDNVGNTRQSSETWMVVGEWNPPQAFELAAPANGDTVLVSKPVLSWLPSVDVGSGIARYELWINGVINRTVSAAGTSTTPAASLPNGIQTWFVKALDHAENSTSSTSTWQFVVDRDITKPISAIITPTAGTTIGGTSYTITGTSNDGTGSGVEKVDVSTDGGVTWYSAANTGTDFSAWEYEWINYPAGSHTIKSRATDKEGNVETPGAGVTVTADLTKPKVTSIVINPNPTSSGNVSVTIYFSVSNSGLNHASVPNVTFTPQGGTATPIVQSSYSGTTWRGAATIAATENNGAAVIAVSGARDNINNVMDPNPTAGTFVIDTVPPQAFDLITPSDSSWVNSRRPTLTWGAASDELSGIGKYQLWIDGALNRNNIPNTATSTTPMSNLGLGEHSWFVKALDTAGNERNSSSTRNLKIDTALPAVQITEPQNGATIGGYIYDIRGTADDGTGSGASGVNTVEISIDNGNWQTVVNTGTDFSSWSFEWTDYSAGEHTMRSRAIDFAGNTGSSPLINITVDFSAPEITNLTVAPNPAKAGEVTATVEFQVGESGMDNSVSPVVTFRPSGDSNKYPISQTSFAGSTWTGTVTIAANMNNGTATIQTSGAQDNNGNIMKPVENAGSFIIDSVAPVVGNVNVTPDPAKAGTVTANISFTEATSGLNTNIAPSVSFTPNGGSPINLIQTGYNVISKLWSGTATLDISMNDGTATIQVKDAVDLAGNVMSENNNAGQFVIDVTPPSTFDLVSPLDSSWTYEGTPKLSWQQTNDATSGLAKFQLYINAELNRDNLSPSTASTTPASDLVDGAYLWHILVIDNAGNETKSTSTRMLRIDKSPPESEITNLTSGQEAAGTVMVEGTANDGLGAVAGCGVKSVSVSTDGGAIWNTAANTGTDFDTWKYEWNMQESGNFTIKSKAVDLIGNEEIPGDGILITDVDLNSQNQIPTEFSLSQNYPNPFNPETIIEYQIPKKSQVTIRIYNLVGQEIVNLVNEGKDVGNFKIVWDGKDSFGTIVTSGVYVYQMRAGDFVTSRKLILLR